MLTTREVIEETGVSRSTLFRWVRRGLIPAPDVGIQPAGPGRTSWWHEVSVRNIHRIRYWTRKGIRHKAAVRKRTPNER